MKHLLAICVMALVAAAVVRGAAVYGDGMLSATGDARVAVFIDGTGQLREKHSGGRRLGLRWPGPGGNEFLGSCGFVLRFERGDDGPPAILEQGAMRPGPRETGIGDEDITDDGRFVLVTGAVSREGHVSITQEHYHWSFGHIRDFIAFTTRISHASPRGATHALRGLEAALVTDFRIGDPDDPARADNDRFRFLAGGEDDLRDRRAAVVPTAREPDGPLVAVAVFFAAGPGGGPLEVASAIMPARLARDSLWAESAWAGALRAEGAGEPQVGAARLPEDLGEGLRGSVEVAGDQAVVHRFGAVCELAPNESVVVEWALVFGHDPASLMRNVARARETWAGRDDPVAGTVRWVAPARKARRVEVEAALAPVWVQGQRRTAAVVVLEAGAAEEVEWLAVAGERVDRFERVGDRIVTVIEPAVVSTGGAVALEGQLADGTIFAARITEVDLERFSGDNELAPGRLPEQCLRLFPNPFVSNTTINISLDERTGSDSDSVVISGTGSVRIYDVRGRLVRSILDEELYPGDYLLDWDGTDESGAAVAPGVYYCRLQIGERSLTKRVILLR